MAQLQPRRVGDQEHPTTIGDALELAGRRAGDEPLEEKHVAAIQSAECKATGRREGAGREGAAHMAQILLERNQGTLGQVLTGEKSRLPADKIVNEDDAKHIMSVERGHDPQHLVEPGGIGYTMKEAADYNKKHGYLPSSKASQGLAQDSGSYADVMSPNDNHLRPAVAEKRPPRHEADRVG